MDADLDLMTREQLIAEARGYEPRFGGTATAPDTRSAGITRHSGASYPRRPTRCRRCLRGRSFSEAVYSTASLWIGSCLMLPVQTRRIGREDGATSRGCDSRRTSRWSGPLARVRSPRPLNVPLGGLGRTRPMSLSPSAATHASAGRRRVSRRLAA